MQIIDERECWRAHFEGPWEVVDWLASTPYMWKDKAPIKNDGHYLTATWALGHTYEEVLQLARDGWEDGVAKVSAALHAPVNNKANAWRYDVAGEMPDVSRFLGGDPAHMRRRGHDNRQAPIISIFVNNWINGAVKAANMVNFGAALVGLIDRIEASGKRVELIAGTVAPNSPMGACEPRVMAATWTVKHAQDPLDLSALAFSLAHPGASRRFGWTVWAHSDRASDRGFGQAVNWDVKPEHLIDPHPKLLIIRGLNGQWDRCQTFEDAVRMVATQLNAAAERLGMPSLVEPEL